MALRLWGRVATSDRAGCVHDHRRSGCRRPYSFWPCLGYTFTGFMLLNTAWEAKLLELLKEIAPGALTRVGPRHRAAPLYSGIIQAAAPSLKAEVSPVRGPSLSRAPRIGGLIVTGSAPGEVHRDLIVALAAMVLCFPRISSSSLAGGLKDSGPDH